MPIMVIILIIAMIILIIIVIMVIIIIIIIIQCKYKLSFSPDFLNISEIKKQSTQGFFSDKVGGFI